MIHEVSLTFTSNFTINDYVTSDYPSMLQQMLQHLDHVAQKRSSIQITSRLILRAA